MATFRRSGSFLRFYVDGPAPDLNDRAILRALERERFRPIADGGVEEESVGWITRRDPSGERFEPEDVVSGHFLSFAFRVDRKRVPPTLLRLRAAADLRAAAVGDARIPRAKKKEIVEEAKRSLLKRALPNVSIVDCAWHAREGVLYAFTTGEALTERVLRHFRATFRRSLARATPSVVAERLRLPEPARRRLAEASRVDWSAAKAAVEVEA